MRDETTHPDAIAPTDLWADSPVHIALRVLRGRYHHVILLSGVLAIIGALVGYSVVTPTYQSTGLVRIEGAMPVILYPTLENQVPPMFDRYLAAQVVELRSWQALEQAVKQPEMVEAGWPDGPEGIGALQSALSVNLGRGEQIITVSVSHGNPQMAQTAVNAVLAAYRNNVTYPGGLSPSSKEHALGVREQSLIEQIAAIEHDVLVMSDQFGKDALERIHLTKITELMAIEQTLDEIRESRARLDAGEIEANDGDVTAPLSLLDEQELQLTAEIKSLETRFRPGHRMIRELKRRLELLRQTRDLRDGAIRADADDGTPVNQPAIARLDELEAHYAARRDEVRDEATELSQKRAAITALGEQAAELKQRLARTRQRLDEIRFEASRHADRISIVQGDYPVTPISDRRTGLAAAAALCGLAGGAGLVFLLALRDPRVRYIEELETMNLGAPIISLLPMVQVDDLMSDAWTLHQLRNLLEVKGGTPHHNVYAISSCADDEGRTSLVVALGSCFARAGRNTLVIDADFARTRLSRELGVATAPGLCEALGPISAAERIHPTSRPKLWCMPVGSIGSLAPQDLSLDRLELLLEELRRQFDAVIIDTGPILTDVEAGLVTTASDGVVMVVRRGQQGELVRSSISRTRQLGANCVGVVFNKASSVDLERREAAAVDVPPPVADAIGDEDDVNPVVGVIRDHTGVTDQRKKAA